MDIACSSYDRYQLGTREFARHLARSDRRCPEIPGISTALHDRQSRPYREQRRDRDGYKWVLRRYNSLEHGHIRIYACGSAHDAGGTSWSPQSSNNMTDAPAGDSGKGPWPYGARGAARSTAPGHCLWRLDGECVRQAGQRLAASPALLLCAAPGAPSALRNKLRARSIRPVPSARPTTSTRPTSSAPRVRRPAATTLEHGRFRVAGSRPSLALFFASATRPRCRSLKSHGSHDAEHVRGIAGLQQCARLIGLTMAPS